MAKSTFPVSGGAMPKFDRGSIMRRAWAIFAEAYKFPQIAFNDIGRKCFGWGLRKAWAEAREAARVAAISPEVRAERIETLHGLIQRAAFIDSHPQWRATIAAHRQELRALQAAGG